jgi:hypothetical protein
MYRRSCLVIAATLMASAINLGQEKGVLTQGQRVVIENPEVIALQLAPIIRRRSAGLYKQAYDPFNPESKIKFELIAINNSSIPLDVLSWDQYAQNRPRLLRDNQEVPYRTGLMELLENKDKDDLDIVHIFVMRLQPGERKVIDHLDISEWYMPLETGHYELSVQHRFGHAGKLVNSALVVFEVEKKK